MASFRGIAAHSDDLLISLFQYLFVILIIFQLFFRGGGGGGDWALLAPLPDYCLHLTFNVKKHTHNDCSDKTIMQGMIRHVSI